MTRRERDTMERIVIDMQADACGPSRMYHYVRALRAFLDRDYKFLRDHNYRLTPSQEEGR